MRVPPCERTACPVPHLPAGSLTHCSCASENLLACNIWENRKTVVLSNILQQKVEFTDRIFSSFPGAPEHIRHINRARCPSLQQGESPRKTDQASLFPCRVVVRKALRSREDEGAALALLLQS